MNYLRGYAGILGGVIFGFGLMLSLFAGDVGDLLWMLLMSHLVIGGILILFWFMTSGIKALGGTQGEAIGRGIRFGLGASTNVILVLALLVAANWYAHKNNKRWDTTEEGVYSLSSQTTSAIQRLDKTLKIVGFVGLQQVDDIKLKETLDMYGYQSKRVQTEIVNPRSKPHLVEAYGMNAGNVIYLEYGEGEAKGVSRINDYTEEAITNAILKLTRGAAKKIYFVEGHGEPDPTTMNADGMRVWANGIEDENLKHEKLFLGQAGKVPEDAAAVIVVAPKKAMSDQEKKALIEYVDAGGRLLLFTDPQGSKDIRELAAHFGIEIRDDVVVDTVQQLFGGPALSTEFIVRDYGSFGGSTGLTPRDVTVFREASSVAKSAKPTEGATYTELVRTSVNAFGETDLVGLYDQSDPRAEKNGPDAGGPLAIGLAYEKPVAGSTNGGDGAEFEKKGRVVVFGDSDWVINSGIQPYANRDLALNVVNWSIGEEGGVTIRPRALRSTRLEPIGALEFRRILGTSFLLPELILLVGLFVWWRRRALSI